MSGPVSLRFTEKMRGFITLDETDPHRGYVQGRADRTPLMFMLTIGTDDVDAFIADPRHEATATGYVDCDVLGGRRPVDTGLFNLFVTDRPAAPKPAPTSTSKPAPDPIPDAIPDSARRRMLYRLPFSDAAGHPLTLSGFKDVHQDPGSDLWRDTSTLYTRIYAGHVDAAAEAEARIVGAGIITIHLTDFLHQLTTFRASGSGAGTGPGMHGAGGLERFGRLFLGELWQVYGPAARAATAAPGGDVR